MQEMNIKFLIIPALFLALACSNKRSREISNVIHFESGFSLYQDTITVNIKGEMTHALKYNDKFYVLFKQKVLKYGGYGKRWLYVFSNGGIEQIIDCPKEMDAVYLDFFVQNDSILLKPYMDKQCYYFNVYDSIWEKADTSSDLIFEDDRFYVYSLDFGEWGGKTWFKEKETGREYVIESTTPLINKTGAAYYLTKPFEVVKITDPTLLNECDDDIRYENIKTNGRFDPWYEKPIGFDVIYRNSTADRVYFSYNPRIVSSFVWQDELLHIYETDTVTYIAKVENDSLKTIQAIGKNMRFYNWYYSYRCKNVNGSNELLKLRTDDGKLSGLLYMDDNKAYMHYFSNEAELEPKSFGNAKADSIFIDRLELILSDPDGLTLTDIDSAERAWNTFDITPNHKIGIGDSWNPGRYEIDTGKSYLIKEDSLISNSIIYYATQSNNLVRAITCNWEETTMRRFGSEEVANEVFKRKVTFLENHIIRKAGEPVEKVSKKNYIETVWETPNGLKIELENMKNFNRIRLIIYKSE